MSPNMLWLLLLSLFFPIAPDLMEFRSLNSLFSINFITLKLDDRRIGKSASEATFQSDTNI